MIGSTTLILAGGLLLARITLLLAAGFALDRALRGRSAAVRHTLWVLVLGAVLATPLLSTLLPSLPVLPVPTAMLEAPRTISTASVEAGEGNAADAGFPVPSREDGAAGYAPAVSGSDGSEAQGGTAPVRRIRARFAAHSALGPLAAAWLTGTFLLMVLGGFGVVLGRRIVRRARPVDEADLTSLLEAAGRAVGLRRDVQARESAHLRVPVTTGLFRPVVILPETWRGWERERLRSVLLHECAHVARRDVWTRLAAGLACAVYWFHPGVWLAWRRLVREGERACDDRVLLAGIAPDRYARHLLEVAREARRRRVPVLAVAMARPHELEGRLLDVLSRDRRRRPPSTAGALAATAMALSLTAAVATAGLWAPEAASAEPARMEGPVPVAAPAPTTTAPDPTRSDGTVTTGERPDEERPVVDKEATAAMAAGGPAPPDGEPSFQWREHESPEPERWSAAIPDLPARDRRMVAVGVELLEQVLPEVERTVLREIVLEAWAHMDIDVVRGEGDDDLLPIWILGHSHLRVRRGGEGGSTVHVSTLGGPLDRALPGLVRRSLLSAGRVEDARRAVVREAALSEVGARLASSWEEFIRAGGELWESGSRRRGPGVGQESPVAMVRATKNPPRPGRP